MKFYLRRVRINQDGYEADGTYWGVGMPLYHYWHEWEEHPDEYVEAWIRAEDRIEAKERILALYPDAKFSH